MQASVRNYKTTTANNASDATEIQLSASVLIINVLEQRLFSTQ